jgi:3'(2'), 5'-bisphosphate nucleotidase/myo-inositol-1(or 4)-monophosphatase
MAMKDAVAELVREVGQSLLSWRTAGGVEGAWDGSQFHAKADRWAHEKLCLGLAAIAPPIPIVSEEDESPEAACEAEVYWLIDPIDGTASYAQGFSGFVTQVALMNRQVPVLAAVFAPAHQQLFVAERGRGAFCNGLRLPAERSAGLTLIDNTPSPSGVAADLYAAWPFAHYLECGSIGLKICRVADGTADVFVKAVTVRDWDLAPPHLILQEAGGCLVDGAGADVAYGPPRRHTGLVAARDGALAGSLVRWRQARDSGSEPLPDTRDDSAGRGHEPAGANERSHAKPSSSG